MFAGMRESEAFALWCGDIANDGIHIERSFYKGRYGPPKTPKSERKVGVPEEILTGCSVGSGAYRQTVRRTAFSVVQRGDPHLAGERSKEYVRPKLRPFELGWINFAVLRRSHSTLHKQRNSDLKIIADQQGHGMRTTWTITSRAGWRNGRRKPQSFTPILLGCFANEVNRG